jgi:adenosylcobyric acid synthase
MIEELCGVPVIGVLPYFKDIFIEEEDSVPLPLKKREAVKDKINVAVILLHRLSNFTDFDRLEKDPRVNLFYTVDPAEIAKSDILILPGSKNTIEDLIALKNNGVAAALIQAHKNGKTVIGICGGYQMMGEQIEDPFGVESKTPKVAGLGLLPLHTVLTKEKTTLQRTFTYRRHAEQCTGYEIHMGQTAVTGNGYEPLITFTDGGTDGCYAGSTCWGTYVHGILDNDAVVNDLLSTCSNSLATSFDYRQYKEAQYDKLAQLIREHVDLKQVYQNMKS